MDAMEVFAHLDKHRPHVGEILSQQSIAEDPDEVRRRLEEMERLFGEMWALEHQLVDSLRFSWIPWRKPRFSQAAMDRYIACLSTMCERGLIGRERVDDIVGPLKGVASYR